MTLTDDRETSLTVTLLPAIVSEPLGYIDRIMADGKVTAGEIFTEMFAPAQPQPPKPIGSLSMNSEGAYMQMFQRSEITYQGWDKPFVVLVNHWPFDEHSAEICVSMRSRGGHPEAPWMRFRTLWPLRALAQGLPRKQAYAPFVHPKHFPSLWRLIEGAAALHGERLPDLITDEVSEEALALLKSVQGEARCVACDATSVQVVGPEVYVCHVCGYEGGDGYSEYTARRKRQAYTGVAYKTRLTLAIKDLSLARDDLMAASTYGWTVRKNDKGQEIEESAIERNHAWKHRGMAFMSIREASYKLPEHAETIAVLLEYEEQVHNGEQADTVRAVVESVINTLIPHTLSPTSKP